MNFNVVGTPGNDTPLTDEERLIEFTRTLAEANHGPNLLHRNITEIRSVHSDSEDSGDEMEPTVSFSVELPESDTSLSDKEEEMIRALTEGNLGPNPHLQSTSEIHSVHSDNEDPVDELERLREVDHHILTRSPRCFVCLVGTKHVSQVILTWQLQLIHFYSFLSSFSLSLFLGKSLTTFLILRR